MTYLTEGIVLKKENYRDFDCQYTIYTKKRGKVLAIAKGAKKITSKLNPHLEFFLIVNLMLADGSFCSRVAAAQIVRNFKEVRGDLAKALAAIYALEAVDTLVKYDFADEPVFELTENFLGRLSLAPSLPEVLMSVNQFLFDFLSHLGYCPIIRAKNQKALFKDLNDLVQETGERQMKSFGSFGRMLVC